MNDSRKIERNRITKELLAKIQAFIDAEWIPPVVSDFDACGGPLGSEMTAPEPFLYEDAEYSMPEESPQTAEGINALPDFEVTDSLQSRKMFSRHREYSPLAQRDAASFDDIIGPLGQTFQEKLLAIIDAKGMKDSDVYNRANIDRRLFSKIRSNKNYKPSKPTALAFAIALGLNLDETTDLLQRAGLALSPSSKADLIVKYCIMNGIHDIYDVNGILYEYDQQLLGY